MIQNEIQSTSEEALNRIAYAISIILHPLFHFIYVFILSLLITPGNIAGDTLSIAIFTGLLFLNTTIFPALGAYLLTGSIDIKERHQRTWAYGAAIFFYFLAYYFLWQIPVYDFLKAYLLSLAIGMIALMALNLRWKISMHATGGGSLIAFFAHQYYVMPDTYFLPLLAGILVAGLIGSARLKLKAHNNIEIYVGYIIGFTITGIVMGNLLY